jgi:hypothetical protein
LRQQIVEIYEPDMMAQSSRAGMGLAYVGEWIVADDIASGGWLKF